MNSKAKITVVIICVVIAAGVVVSFWPAKVKNSEVISCCMQQVRAIGEPAEVREDKKAEDALSLVEAEKEIKSTSEVKPTGKLQEEMIEGLGHRAIKLLEFPPPEIEVEIVDMSAGPASIKGVYRFEKDDKFYVRSYLIASESRDAEPEEWLDLGTFRHQVQDVDPDTKASTVVQNQIRDGRISLRPEGGLAVSGSKMIFYPDGRVVFGDAIEIDAGSRGMRSTVTKESSIASNLIFPDYEISQGQSWQIEDENNKENKATFRFEKYCTVNGVECMKIVVDSTVISNVNFRHGWDGRDYQIESYTRTTGAYYFDYQRGIVQFSDLTSEVEILSGLGGNNEAERPINFFRKVTYVEK